MSARRRPFRTLVPVTLAALTLVLAGLALPANAAGTASVKGVVVLDGKPVKGLKVQLQESESGDSYDPVASTTTSSTGSYSLSKFSFSSSFGYQVLVTDPTGKIVSTVRWFRARAGKTTTRNVTVKAAGYLTGKVTRADGSPATGTRVHLVGPDVQIGTPDQEIFAYDTDRGVRSNGVYRFVGLPAGSYTVRYTDTSGRFLDQCYDDVLAVKGAEPTCDPYDAPQATKVTVSAAATQTLAAQQLHNLGARLRGTVTDTFGKPIKGIDVTPIPTGTNDNAYVDYLAQSRSTGRFTRSPIQAGSYQLRVTDDGRRDWAGQWFGGQNHSGAKVFDLAAGQTVNDIAIKLKSRASLKVSATPHVKWAAFTVSVTRRASGGRPSGTVTATLGSVSRSAKLSKGTATVKLKGIPSGKQRVTISYGGAGSTAPATKTVVVRVK